MKIKELMIGDIVRNINDGTIMHISKIGGILIEASNGVLFFSEDDIEPIPLTKEIMFANGFESSGCKGMLAHKTDKDLKVYYDIDHFDGTDWIVKEWSVLGIAGIESVHEYQHYLRLVGKTNFADNFKIK